jgi:CBS-domain-containing membrane protein
MCDEHIHRLPVLDGSGRITGVITSLDIVAAMANAADEQRQSPKRSQVRREKR